MTKEEAIFALEYYKLHFADRVAIEAFDMAIKALEQETYKRNCKNCKHSNGGKCAGTEECHECMWDSKYEPKQKMGHWIVEVWTNREHHTCSECNHVVDYEPCYHYCPYCGAEMQEVK